MQRHGRIEVTYEAGPCGYGIYRQLAEMGIVCRIVAPSHTPKRPGERVKNDTRDALMLARLLRAGELTFVWVPDVTHEAMRDLVRARQVASQDVRAARALIQMFLLKHGLAALAAAQIPPCDLVLEPSAGTGLLAILAEITGGSLALNEFADTRADLLRLLFPGCPVTRCEATDRRPDQGNGGPDQPGHRER